jgi:adenylate kinase
MALDIVMLGPPGAGKGTQAVRLAQHYGVPAISTGDMLRGAVQAGNDLGLRVKAVMDRGELVGDDLMIEIVRERLDRSDATAGFVLDGFPRTIPQATALDAMVNGRGLSVINIEVPAEEIVRRLSSRRICRDCAAIAAPAALGPGVVACAKCGGTLVQRADDREDVVRERLAVYERSTRPLLDFYRDRPTFRTIDGLRPPDRVFGAIAEAIDAMAVAGQGK